MPLNTDCLEKDIASLLATCRNIYEIAEWRAEHQGDRIAFVFAAHRGDRVTWLTYRELRDRSAAIARFLADRPERGKPVLLFYPPGLAFLEAFLGCLAAGMVPVPLYPPKSRKRFPWDSVLDDCGAGLALTDDALEPVVRRALAGRNLKLRSTSGLATKPASHQPIGPRTLAFLQYTSGSTGTPKGVAVSHANLLANQAAIGEAFGTTDRDLCLSWLPLYHDMGLIGSFLHALYRGFPSVLMPPLDFVRAPLLWPEMITRFRATLCGGPNFGYRHCAQAQMRDPRQGFDLGSWRVAFNGAEPVQARTLRDFAGVFERFGFRRETFFPCYGMAEATLFVSGGASDSPPRVLTLQWEGLRQMRALPVRPEAVGDVHQLVSCGKPARQTRIRIVDPETRTPLSEGKVGEIWVSGPGVATGYWGKTVESQEVFRAWTEPGGREPCLRTGDLGFLHGGELFVSGRIKDLIVLRGRNYHPQDIEDSLIQPAERDGLGRCVAFSVSRDGAEELVIVHESERRLPERDFLKTAWARMRETVAEVFEITPAEMVLVRPGGIPLTPSGKPRRILCRQRFLADALPVLFRESRQDDRFEAVPGPSAPDPDGLVAMKEPERTRTAQAYLRDRLGPAMGVSSDGLDWHEPLTALGLDSLAAGRIAAGIETDFDVAFDVTEILEMNRLDDLAAALLHRLEPAARNRKIPSCGGPDPMPEDRATPPSFEQERLWLMDRLPPDHPAYHIPALFALRGPLDPDLLERAFTAVMARHDAPRFRFRVERGKPRIAIGSEPGAGLAVVDLRGAGNGTERFEHARRLAAQAVRRRFRLDRDPLVRLELFQSTEREWLLALTAHHLVCDIQSMDLLVRELSFLYTAMPIGGTGPALGPAPSYAAFARDQRRTYRPAAEDLAFWRSCLATPADAVPAGPPPALAKGASLAISLPADLVGGLRTWSAERGATLFQTLFAAWNLVLHRSGGGTVLDVAVPISGRFTPEAEETVGFFAYPLVVRLDLTGDPTVDEILAHVRERFLAAYRHRRLPYSKVAEAVYSVRKPPHRPLFRVMFGFYDREPAQPGFPGIRAEPLDLDRGTAFFDLFPTLYRHGQGLRGRLEYDANRYGRKEVEERFTFWREILTAMMREPFRRMSAFALPRTLAGSDRAANEPVSLPTVAIAATFTPDPLADSLEFWFRELGRPHEVRFAPFNQVFQQLLDPGGIFAANRAGANVVLLRIQDLLQERADSNLPGLDKAILKGRIGELADAVSSRVTPVETPVFVVVCPCAPAFLEEKGREASVKEAETELIAKLDAIPGVYASAPDRLCAAYGLDGYADERAEREAKLPYTRAYFALLGTAIVRGLQAFHRPPYKAIVLDCDNTLWEGVCAERGPHGVVLDEPRMALQRFMLEQQRRGMLLCLCSKNLEADVLRVFEARPEMPLRLSHFAERRIDWCAKSENLHKLAASLDLGLDSFIFVDDNPVEIAEVRARCPQVLALPLPEPAAAIPGFLARTWAFDRLTVSDEDRRRTRLYQENRQRRMALREASTFASFLAGLQMRIAVRPLEDLARAAQLTQRTNQFNATALRRTEPQLRHLLDSGSLEGLEIEVSDRFGDYGTVGVVLFKASAEDMEVDTFLLSCRVLGKGVEHAVVAGLAQRALDRGLERLRLPYRPSERNIPVARFLESLKADRLDGRDRATTFVCRAEDLVTLRFEPDATIPDTEDSEHSAEAARHQSPPLPEPAVDPGPGPHEHADARQLTALIHPQRHREARVGFVPPRSGVERELAAIWAELLDLDAVGIRDNFFELGGNSVLATQILSRIYDSFAVDLPLPDFFEALTVENLAAVVESNRAEGPIHGEDRGTNPLALEGRDGKGEALESLIAQLNDLPEERVAEMLADRDALTAFESARNETAAKPEPENAKRAHSHYRKAWLQTIELEGETLALDPVSGRCHALTPPQTELWQTCGHFDTLAGHAARYRETRGPEASERDALSGLEQMADRGLLLTRGSLVDTIASAEPRPTPIAAIGIPTANRASTCEQALASYSANTRQYGRDIEFSVLDDSRKPAARREYRQMLESLKVRTGTRLSYAGLEEKEAFIGALSSAGAAPPHVLRFALIGEKWDPFTGGSNANGLLLHHAGDAYFSVDDDTLCRFTETPDRKPGAAVLAAESHKENPLFPTQFRGFPDRASFADAVEFVDLDLIGLLERVLGQGPGGCLARTPLEELDLDRAGERAIRDLGRGLGKVLVTLPGILGDCGWSTPSVYLLFSGASFERLTVSESHYRKAVTYREMWRVADRLVLADRVDNLMSCALGLDHRDFLPPRMPTGRGEDVFLGKVISACFVDGYFAYLPYTLLHQPAESRAFWPGEIFKTATGTDVFILVASCLDGCVFNDSETDPRARLRTLGRHFQWIGSLPESDFDTYVRGQIWGQVGQYMRYLERLRQERNGRPEFWARDIERFLQLFRQSLNKETYFLPFEMLKGRRPEEARQLSRDYLFKLGELFEHWPAMVDAAKALRRQGTRLAHPI